MAIMPIYGKNNKPKLTMTYFNFIKEIRWELQVL